MPSSYQQQPDYSSQSQVNRYNMNGVNQIKLNSVISNPNLISNRSTPSPTQARTISQPNLKQEIYFHVNVAKLKSKFDNVAEQKLNNLNVKTLDKKSLSEANVQLENRVLKQLQTAKKEASKDLTMKDGKDTIYEALSKHSNLLINCDELNRSDYQINNYQTEQLEMLQKETERIEQEKNEIANNINETDLKIAKCRQKIQILMDEIKGK